jgi:hypothetical protein
LLLQREATFGVGVQEQFAGLLVETELARRRLRAHHRIVCAEQDLCAAVAAQAANQLGRILVAYVGRGAMYTFGYFVGRQIISALVRRRPGGESAGRSRETRSGLVWPTWVRNGMPGWDG